MLALYYELPAMKDQINTLSAVRPILGRKKFETNCFSIVMYDPQGDILFL